MNSFLVDNGAEISLYPASETEKLKARPTFDLEGPDGSPIPTYGQKAIKFSIGKHRFEWTFKLAPIGRASLGADFFIENDLLVDQKRRRLLNAKNFYEARLEPVNFMNDA